MRLQESISAQPIQAEKSIRGDYLRNVTSAFAGKVVPIGYVPLHREDRVSMGNVRVHFEMMETAELLLNAVNVVVYAHFIPYLASPRFNGMDQLNRSYMGEPEEEGGDVKPFFTTINFDRDAEFWKVMGMHAPQGKAVNAFPVEAYNLLVNFRRKARSTKLSERLLDDTTLATGFWHHTSMAHIVPDFDQAMIDGEVDLEFATTKLPVRGVGRATAGAVYPTVQDDLAYSSIDVGGGADSGVWEHGVTTNQDLIIMKSSEFGTPEIWTELMDSGVKVSLANIELAKQTAAFAKIRSRYSGLSEEHIMDLLMQGIRVPEEQMSQPILLDRKQTIMGYNRRYATDAENLAESMTNGETYVDLRLRTPAMNTGGIIMITAEVVPEQLFERQKDYYLYAQTPDDLPNFLQDYLDPEKVDIVQNEHADVMHSDPDGTFGYAPLNHMWKRDHVRIGGKYYRPEVDASFDEDRQKFWAAETLDPQLTEDFYLCTQLHHKVFADTTSDPMEISLRGNFTIVGNTVFGKGLQEDTEDYEHIMAQVDTDRIDQEAGA